MSYFLIGILVFFAINLGLTLAFRHWDLHWWLDSVVTDIKEWFRK